MLIPLKFPPGVYRNGTEYEGRGRWRDSNLVRFFENTIRPVGGWRAKTRTGSLANPFTTVNTSNVVTVAHTAHGLRVGDRATYTGGVAVGGLTMTGAERVVATVPGADSYTFLHTGNATSTVAVGAGGAVSYSLTQSVSGAARAILTWKENTLSTWAAIGTHSKLYVLNRAGQVFDITPAGYTTGRADAVAAGGYGSGAYGSGAYGTPRPDTTLVQDATVWSMDTFGQNWVGCNADDGDIYEWVLPATGTPAAPVTNAPSAGALVVTEEGMLMALGAGSNPRRAQWSDQQNNTVWTPAATNQAGDFDLQTQGRLMCGKRIRGGTLLFTDRDVHLCTYIGGTLIFSFSKFAESCGVISRSAVAVLDARTVWMGESGFWTYNGYVEPLPCDVSDYVFSDMNTLQQSKITCEINSAFGEVTWRYCSGASDEIDREVTWNYRENHWTLGAVVRLCGADKGHFLYVLRVGSDGVIYEHEVGTSYGGSTPYLESAPFELGNGDEAMEVTQLVPDESTAGSVTATFKARFYPNGAETTYGPYAIANPTHMLFSARQIKLRLESVSSTDWRIGTMRLDMHAAGLL